LRCSCASTQPNKPKCLFLLKEIFTVYCSGSQGPIDSATAFIGSARRFFSFLLSD
jgi:hypothetical protein